MKTLVILYCLYIEAFITYAHHILSELPFPFALFWRQNFEILKDAKGESLHMFHSFSFPLALSPIFFLPRSILCSPGPSHAGIQAVSLGPCFRPQPPPNSSLYTVQQWLKTSGLWCSVYSMNSNSVS
jgi:hypothetical protein